MAQPVSDEFRSLLGRDAEEVHQVEIYSADDVLLYSTDPSIESPITIADVDVTDDKARSVRGTCDVTIVAEGNEDEISPLIPSTVTDVMSPLSGAYYRLRSGFRLPSTGKPELVTVGTYYFDDTDIEEDSDGVTIQLHGQDFTGRLDVADIWEPTTIARGTNVVNAIAALITPILPNVEIVADATWHTTPEVVLDVQTNRLDEITKLATSIGFEIYADPLGRIVIAKIETTDDDPQWSFESGDLTPLTRARNGLSAARVHNGAIVRGENMRDVDTPVQGEAWDTDPSSPYYYDPANPTASVIGPRPMFETSEYARTQSQVDDAAVGLLRRWRGLTQRVEIEIVKNPAVNVGDVVEVTREQVGVIGRFIVERRQFSGGTSPMQVSLQERRL